MRRITLSTRLLSDAVWKRLFETAAARQLDQSTALFSALGTLDALRSKAQYNTGSISTAAQWSLYALAYAWCPTVIAEVGTFIGKSTLALSLGADAAGAAAEVHTCDMSNHLELPASMTKCRIVQYPGSPSTQMLAEMLEDGFAGKVEMFHFDGRLQKDDIPHVASLASKDAVIVLDDFEGTEKGVANMFALRANPAFRDHLSVYPPTEALLGRIGFADHATCALLFPRSCVDFSAQ